MAIDREALDFLEQINKSLRGVDGITKEYRATLTKATSEMLNQYKLLASGTKKTSDAYRESGTRIKALVREMASLKARSRDVYDAQEKLEKQAERLSKGYGRFADDFKKMSGYVKNAIGVTGQYASIFGVQSLGVKAGTERLLKYNQAMFNLSRVQQVSGRGMKDMQQVLKTVKDRTTLAKDQFAGLAAEVGNMSIGLAPSTAAIADVASAMKDRFGPSIDVIIAKTKEFFQIQAEWPDVADDIIKAQEAISVNDIKGAEKFKTAALMKSSLMGKSAAELKNMAQMIDKPTEAQLRQIKLNEQLAKSAQSWGDTQILVMEKMIPAIEKAAKASQELADSLAKIPGTLALISGGLTVGGILGGFGTGALFKKGLGMIGTGAAGAAGTGAAGAGAGFGGGAGLSGVAAGAAGTGMAALATPVLIALAATLYAKFKEQKEKGKLELTGHAAEAQVSGRKRFGGEYTRRMAEEGAFQDPSDAQKFLSIHDKITKQLSVEAKETKKTVESASELVIKYTEILQNQTRWLDNFNKGASSLGELVSLGEKMSIADAESAKDQQIYYRQSKEIADIASTYTINLVKQVALTQDVALNIQDTGTAYERLKQAMKEISVAIDKNKNDNEKTKELLDAQRTVAEQLARIRQQEANIIDAMIAQMTTQLNTNNTINDIYENRLSIERQLTETSLMGLGASVDMMQKQVDLAQRRIESNKEALSQAEQVLNSDKQLTTQQIERLQNAQSDIELRNAALEISEKTNKSQAELITYAKQYQTVVTDSGKQQQKILEITKQVREGYLSAMKQAAFGFGQFSKIIGTQTRGVSQLMNLVKRVRGANVTNTMALGGRQSNEMTDAGVGRDAAYTYTTTGVQSGISKQEERNRLGRIWNYSETNRMASGSSRVGTGAAASPADIAVMQQGASAKRASRAGRVVTAPIASISRNIVSGTTAVEKGSQFSPGATLPGQTGIPSNYGGGANIVPPSAGLMKGSQGQVANPSGGPALTPTPLKGASSGAGVSEWMKPMIDKQDETNVKLNDILGQLKSGLTMTALHTA